jgi:hypothetical protein
MTEIDKHALEDSMDRKTDEEIEYILKSKFRAITVHAPTLNEDLEPDIFLLNEVCPNEIVTKNHCGKCEHLVCVNIPDGNIQSYASYKGFCELK